MRRLLITSVIGLLFTSGQAIAADERGLVSHGAEAGAALAPLADFLPPAEASRGTFEPRRPVLLPALYGASALLQGYDAYSTLTVLKRGGVEVNPMMKGITKSPAAFIGLKAGVTLMSIMAAERMWKNHNRVGALVTMAVSNGLMAMVARNNARVLSQVSR